MYVSDRDRFTFYTFVSHERILLQNILYTFVTCQFLSALVNTPLSHIIYKFIQIHDHVGPISVTGIDLHFTLL